MSILINENLLRSKYLQETGNERPTHEFSKDYSTYVEWLEEKVTEHLEKIRKVNLQKTKYRKMDKWMRKVGMVR